MEIKRGILIAQIINFAILFFLVKIFLGDKLIKIINERRVLIRKLKQADEEYEKMIELAKRESNKIIMTANRKKELIEEEGKILAGKERQNILTLATTKGEMIVQDAKKKWEKMMKELESQRTESITSTTELVVNKLFDTHQELKEKYLQTITKELTTQQKKRTAVKH